MKSTVLMYIIHICRILDVIRAADWHTYQVLTKRADRMREIMERYYSENFDSIGPRPIPHLWLGVSAENQKYADERIPLLLDTPASVRFVSYEPAIGPVDLTNLQGVQFDALYGVDHGKRKIDWVIVGGESGHGSRPFDIGWARNLVEQCRAAGVACFVKQLGAVPVNRPTYPNGNTKGETVFLDLNDRKGGDMAEWPADLRIRQFPDHTQNQ